jgi:type 1 fimbriae regulatory protein FimB
MVESSEMRPVESKGRRANEAYRVREHLTEDEIAKLLAALKRNRHGHRDWLIGLLIYRHGLRVSEACDLRWDDIDLTKRTIIVRRFKGSTDSSHHLEKDEHKALGELWRAYAKQRIKSAYVFNNERGQPFGRMGIARMIERAGEAAGLSFPVHVPQCCATRQDTHWRPAGWIPGAFSTTSAMPQSPIRCDIRPCRRSRSKIFGASPNRDPDISPSSLQRSSPGAAQPFRSIATVAAWPVASLACLEVCV